MIDLLFVTPPSRLVVYQGLGTSLAAIEPPVWSGLLAEATRRRGHAVAILDAEAEGLDAGATAQRIAEADARLTVFVIYGQQPSASTHCMPGGRRVMQALGRLGFDGATLVLGTHAAALPERTLREEPYRYVCDGEGLHTILGLLAHLAQGRPLADTPGLWWREGEIVRHSAPAPLIEDLDAELPGQAWDLLDMTRYRAHNWHCFADPASRSSYASLQTSLGCPFKCSFCCINAPFGKPLMRTWGVERVLAQVDTLVGTYGVRNIKIPDEMFVFNPRRVISLCDGLIARGYDLNIWAYARIDTIADVAMLRKLKQAGFNWLAIGIESGSRHVRDGVTKGRFDNAGIASAIGRLRDADINIGANYIFGLPDDTPDSMRATLDLALSLNTEWANFYCAMAYPGSPLYALARQQGWALPDDPGGPGWIGYSQHAYDCLPLPTETLRAEQVLDFRDRAFQEYFTSPAYLRRIAERFGAAALAEVQAMTAQPLRRRHHDQRVEVAELA
jgi:hypothetical protein